MTDQSLNILKSMAGKTIAAVDVTQAPDREQVTLSFSDGSSVSIEHGVNTRRLHAQAAFQHSETPAMNG